MACSDLCEISWSLLTAGQGKKVMHCHHDECVVHKDPERHLTDGALGTLQHAEPYQ